MEIESAARLEASRYRREGIDHEDVLQEARIAAWMETQKTDNISHIRRAARTAAAKAFRSELRWQLRQAYLMEQATISPQQRMLRLLSESAILLAKLENIPGRQAFLLKWDGGLTVREIAKEMRLSPTAVWRHIQQAEKEIALLLEGAAQILLKGGGYGD